MSLIELEGIAKSWGDAIALHHVSLRIEPGSFCVLLGPSGCGKSTTLRIIAGLETASAGELRIDGRDVTALPPAQRGVAMVFQNYALFPHLSVADNIAFGLSVRRVPAPEREQRLREAASLLGLEPLLQRRPSQLSGGQQQRVALGRALVARARVCLMDEPLSNLDAQLRQEMRRELRELQRQLKLTVVYVTHDQAEAMSMADQVVLLSQGRVEQNGAPRELYAKPATTFAARFIGTPPMNLIALESGRIAGSAVDTGLPAAATIGIRPEDIALDADGASPRPAAPKGANPARREGAEGPKGASVIADVRSVEYLGADLVLACAIGSQTVLVRTDGQHQAQAGERIGLKWAPHDMHAFDAAGRRIH